MLKRTLIAALVAVLTLMAPGRLLFGQADQGTITGVVQDPSGAVIGHANVTLTNTDLGQVLNSQTDGAGIYVFSPVKIGNYEITATAPGFETTTQTNLHLSIQERLNVIVTLKPGATSETITVTTEAPLMQTQESSVGQTMATEEINDVPLSGRNWVYIAQLSAGAVPPEGSRGQGKGDFNANGQRAEQNNFILDGVDNNANVVDFYNGASFVAQPPPDALAEFKIQTSDYSAEFGRSAGAMVSASVKSGTNSIHGDLWEYVRNTSLDIHDWNAKNLPVAPYHENQFGATLGGPLIKNKLFLFADVQANRVTFSETGIYSVPTLLERTGNFSELLSPSLTANPSTQLYYRTPTTAPQLIPNNDLSNQQNPGANTVNQTALAILNDYPKPNLGAPGQTYANFSVGRPAKDDTFQWDARMDWNATSKDSAYSRYSYWNEVGLYSPPLGNILDGGSFGDDGKQKDYGANYMFSETHVFTQTLTNEARFGFNYMHTGFQHPNAANLGFAQSIGFGGIPTAPLNGGLPAVNLNSGGANSSTPNPISNGVAGFGSPTWSTTDEHENVYQILDNVTKIWGNHALKAGVSFQSVRFSTLQPQQSRGSYYYSGQYTSNLGAPNTGVGIADFLLDSQSSAGLSNETTNGDSRWNDAAYIQDDWRVTSKLTVNLGIRWEYFQPYKDVGGYQASYNMTDPPSFNPATGMGSGGAVYQIPKEGEQAAEAVFTQTAAACGSNTTKCTFPEVAAADHINIVYSNDPSIVKAQHTNFAPRVGVAYSPDAKTSIRAGYGLFYGGLESTGYYPNLGENYPFQYAANFIPASSCTASNCPTDGISIGTGFANIVAHGFASDVADLQMRGSDPQANTPYTASYNLSVERAINSNIVATLGYVGTHSFHLQVFPDPNNPLALVNNSLGVAAQNSRPLPDFAGSQYTAYAGMSKYNAMQAKVEKRLSNGTSLLATYTWSHALDDAPTPLGVTGDGGYRQSTLIPIKMDYSNSGFDTRQRFTLNAHYDLPFGVGRRFANRTGWLDKVVGGWSVNPTFVAQTGNPFTVDTTGVSTASGGTAFAIKAQDPFKTGGTFASPNPNLVTQVSCAAKTKTRANWYNPCSFQNPWDSNDYAYEPAHYLSTGPNDQYKPQATPDYVTTTAEALNYLGGKRGAVYGPGYNRVNMSVFKDFKTYHEQFFEFRCDGFNILNHPTLGQPSNNGIGSSGGQITAPKSLQHLAPDSRFFQLSMKYNF